MKTNKRNLKNIKKNRNQKKIKKFFCVNNLPVLIGGFSIVLIIFLLVFNLSQRWIGKKEAEINVLEGDVNAPRVMFVGFNPVEDGKTLADYYFSGSFGGKTATEIEDITIQENIDAFKRLSANSINYQLVKKINLTKFPSYSNNFVYDFAKYYDCAHGDPKGICEQQKRLFDYVKWVQDNQICQIANENNVDEIWMMSPTFIMTWENFMIGPKDSFGINGGAYTVPECNKNYAVINMTYDRRGEILCIIMDIKLRQPWT